MDVIDISRKETHKKSRYIDWLFCILKELVWNRIIWGLLVSAFINLAAYSYITNNYKTYMETEENIRNILTSTVTIVQGIEANIEKVKFNYIISDYDYDKDKGINYVELVFQPQDTTYNASDFLIDAGSGRGMELNNVRIYGEGTQGIYIYNRNTNELINNMFSLGFSIREEKEIKEILITESTSPYAKWFLDTFK
ncbi:hypothetical protein [Paenibacillus taichungensis]|uniref:hypothetical protein n=1 Tax=Paenibacillus taichungensis TaxID=484184 RepID=UPI0028711362|nr:hypothetical protein [Paenibacillus taichungensis]MDR9749288.1 hypothetical protein [Paenibacillus taichungensis]